MAAFQCVNGVAARQRRFQSARKVFGCAAFFALNPPLLPCRNFVLALLKLQLQNKNRLENYTA